MRKNNIKLIFCFIFLFTLLSCEGARDALEGKKRSSESDEFLVKKKNPLSMPPNVDKLPSPGDDLKNKEKQEGLKEILKIKNAKENESQNSKSSNLLDDIKKKIE